MNKKLLITILILVSVNLFFSTYNFILWCEISVNENLKVFNELSK